MDLIEQYSVNDGDYTDYSPYECIQYMIENDYEKEHIIGYKLNILKLEQCIDDKTLDLMQDILHNRCDDRCDEKDWLSDKLGEIWDKFKELKMFYDCGDYYIITEEDYNEVIKDL